MTMFVTTSATPNNNQPPSYIVAATTATAPTTPTATTATTGSIDATSSSTAPQILSDIQLICMQRKKVCFNICINSFEWKGIGNTPYNICGRDIDMQVLV